MAPAPFGDDVLTRPVICECKHATPRGGRCHLAARCAGPPRCRASRGTAAEAVHVGSGAVDLDPVEIRVLGCLLEKQRTTPDAYPLSLNGLRLACNQSTNRDPVVEYDEATIRDALQRLGRRRWTRLTSGHGSRAAKYRHLLEEELGIHRPEQAVLAVLMLRGPQTPGELRARTERLYAFPDAAALQAALDELVRREFAVRLDRRPGQKEERYMHLLADDAPEAPEVPEPAPAAAGGVPAEPRESRLDRLEREVAELREQVATLLRERSGPD
jgi:uncharacterized protein YceH (UPF0502 family)